MRCSTSSIYRSLAAVSLVLLSSLSYAHCDRLSTEMAKEAGDPQGSNACLPRSQNSALPTKKELEFLAQLATTDGGTNPYLAQDKHGVIVSIAELKNTVALDNPKLVAKRAKADDDFFKQLAGLDCIGC